MKIRNSNSRTIEQIYAEIGLSRPNDIFGNPLVGDVQFVETAIDDRQDSSSNTTNDRAASYSIFNAEAEMYLSECFYIDSTINHDLPLDPEIVQSIVTDPGCKQYTLNRWNYAEFRRHLAPRIVGYGAAFLKHLARGTMEISRPNDTALANLSIDSDTNSVIKLPLQLTNTSKRTQDSSQIEAIGEGKLVAVVTFADTQGDVTDVYTSEEIAVTSGQDSNYLAPTFQFVMRDSSGVATPKPFPLSIPDKTPYIQVIFRGTLGVEADNIVVERRPLYEVIKPIGFNIATPDSGVYAITNHSSQGTGFSSLKVKLSTIDGFDGEITPVITYHLNNCYTDDLQGEFNVGGQEARLCPSSFYRSEESYSIPIEIAETASRTIQASSLNATGTEFTLNLSTPIPFNATDLKIEYYHFPSDPAAPIGVGVSDISEPTYIAAINNTDYYSISGTYYSIEEMLAGDMAAYVEETKIYPTAIDLTIKTNGIPAATITGLPAGGYARFAVLTSPNESTAAPFTLEMDGTGTNFRPRFASGINAAIAQLDSSTNTIRYSYLPTFRGVTAHYPIYFEQTRLGLIDGDPSTMPLIEPAIQTAVTVLQP